MSAAVTVIGLPRETKCMPARTPRVMAGNTALAVFC